jgi:hypothetical protein
MTIAIWIVSGLLAAMYLFAGASKTLLPVEKLNKQFPWSLVTGTRNARLIGISQVLGAIGLILPPLTGILPILAAWAAVGLALVQVAAIIFHVRQGEAKVLPMNIVLLLLAVFVAVGRSLGF